MNIQPSFVQLIDLPDEILLVIFRKLSNIDAFYSLVDVSTRFNRILSDRILTRSLTLLQCTWDQFIYPLPDAMLNRFCSKIFPQISHKIEWLNIESSCLERILYAAEYSNLRGIGLFNVTDEIVQRIFIGKKFYFHLSSGMYCFFYKNNHGFPLTKDRKELFLDVVSC